MAPLKRIRCVGLDANRVRIEVAEKFLVVDDAEVVELARELLTYIERRNY